MKRITSFIIAFAIALTVVNGLELPITELALQACTTVETCDEQLAAIAKEKEALQQIIDAGTTDLNNIMEQIFAYSDQIQILQDETTIIETSINIIQTEIDTITEQLAEKDELVRDRLVVQQQQKNNSTYLALLVSATTVSDLINKWSALNTLQKYENDIMREYFEAKEQQLLLKESQETKRTEITTKQTEIEQAKTAQEAVMAIIREEMTKNADALGELATTESELDRQREILNQPDPEPEPEDVVTETPVTPTPDGSGSETETPSVPETPTAPEVTPTPTQSWYLPVGSGGVVTSLYRSENYYNWIGSVHLGIDVGAYRGAPIYAAANGRVLLSDNFCYEGNYSCNGGFGNLIVVSHRDVNGVAYVTLYAHLNSTNVNVGDYVYGGNQIGTMGNTGHSYGAHLHFELLANTELFYGDRASRDRLTVDPLNYLPWHSSWSVRWDA